ncbi:hypothetical protein H310_12151 [Aphanomyces invadans]|uniref:RanBP2-type domain-containing protein n=1 Tax=Aphanomyces invadans TaxID=157072 RepID=A0A024TKK8_9STRA|nr:hypothetical protein H310_12151 [Aphanomyces invadans]ETV94151.1 hypothetical protein H310_12151 [Aphanomyces invadans]|eukprot:XP_008877354.1 hypothetical protein H310_12151 [Aphanomyces invadans]
MMGGGPPPRLGADGDWVCPKEGCGNINFARRMECNRCFTPRLDAPKKQFGDRSFEKKTGLFGPGDWACGKCGNMNWERRNECNICKAPKSSLGPDEKRDGAGGGFNERQDRVASARREVADDGYDDFGQRRQKATVSQKDREAAALARLKASYSAIYTNEPSGGAQCSDDDATTRKPASSRRSPDNTSSRHRSPEGNRRRGSPESSHRRRSPEPSHRRRSPDRRGRSPDRRPSRSRDRYDKPSSGRRNSRSRSRDRRR